MSKQTMKATINANIKQNGVQAITGQVLNSVLNQMVDNYADQGETASALENLEDKTEFIEREDNKTIIDDDVRISSLEVPLSSGEHANVGVMLSDHSEKLTELEQKVNGVEQKVNGVEGQESQTIDLSQYTEVNAFPNGSTWLVNAQYKGKFIPCLPNRDYTFVGHSSNTSIIAFLTSDVYSSGAIIPFASGATLTSVLANETKTIGSPSDATFLWVSTQNGLNKPNELASLVLDGIERQKGLLENFNDLNEFVKGVEIPSVNINIEDYSEESNYIDGVNYFVNAYYKGRFIPCMGGANYSFLANSIKQSSLAFLKSTNGVVSGSTPDYATGWTKTQVFDLGQTLTLTAPSDANYIWVCSQRGTGNRCDFQSITKLGENKKGLASIAYYPSISEQGFPQKDLPVISFVFDDLHENDDDIVKLFNEYGIKCGFAFIASDEKITENKERYLEYQKQGFSILNHSVDGKIFNTTNYPTIESAYNAIMTAKQKLEINGFIVNGFVAPSSQFLNSYIDTLRNTHQYAYTTADLANTRSSNPCRISRESLQTTSLANILGGENVQTSIAFHIAVNRQLTFYGHSADFGISYDGEEFNLAKIRSVVERCISLRNEGKCLILSPNEMANYFFRGQININSNVSANRPLSPQVGMMFFDKTLNKPIWYNGTNWVDATGTLV